MSEDFEAAPSSVDFGAQAGGVQEEATYGFFIPEGLDFINTVYILLFMVALTI